MLEMDMQIVRQKTNVTTLISICNYETYQANGKAESNTISKAISKPNDKANGNKQERKELKEIKEIYIPEFSEFKEYALANQFQTNLSKLEFKYKSWVEAGWIDGKGNKIIKRGLNVQKIIISFIIGIIIGVLIIGAISTNYYSGKIKQLSNRIDTSERLNKELRESNTRLLESNRIATESIGRLENILSERDRYYKSKLGEIKSGFIKIASGLDKTGETIEGIIQGIESIKVFIKSIKWD